MAENGIEDKYIKKTSEPIIPRDILARVPLSPEAKQFVLDSRKTLRNIISGKDTRKLCILGPCSIDDPAPALEYAHKLRELSRTIPELFFIKRTYFEKPRTVSGWKGLINDPRKDNSCDRIEGYYQALRLLTDLADLKVPTYMEVLDVFTPQYIGRPITGVSIGARTVESQTLRAMASGLSCPVGFKNRRDGNTEVAVQAQISARLPGDFLGIGKDGFPRTYYTQGNPDTYVILRGKEIGNIGESNYDFGTIERVLRLQRERNVTPGVVIDCSHDQIKWDGKKDPSRQLEVLKQLTPYLDKPGVLGFMMESYLVSGNQSESTTNPVYGKSFTDPCISFEETEEAIKSLAKFLRKS